MIEIKDVIETPHAVQKTRTFQFFLLFKSCIRSWGKVQILNIYFNLKKIWLTTSELLIKKEKQSVNINKNLDSKDSLASTQLNCLLELFYI